MKEKFLNKKVDYFWEYDYAFGEYFLKELFGDAYKRKYSTEGNGIYNLVYGSDGKIYDLKLTKTKNCMDNETDYKMVDLATILNLLRVEGNQKIFIIDEDGAPLKYGVDDISLDRKSVV